jgi:hypothetical protein
MQELKGDLWDTPCDAVCISTNGFVKRDGSCVMGRGCAKQAVEYFPQLPWDLGALIRNNGNNVHHLLSYDGVDIVSFPVKCVSFTFFNELDCEDIVKHMRYKFKSGDEVPGWACVAEISIIRRSAEQLVEMANIYGWKKVLIPRVGCGAGELQWSKVKYILDGILDDRFYAVTFR